MHSLYTVLVRVSGHFSSHRIDPNIIIRPSQIPRLITCFPVVNSKMCRSKPGNLRSILTVVDDNGIVITAAYESFSICSKIYAINFVLIFAKNLGDPKVSNHSVGKLHFCSLPDISVCGREVSNK